MRFFTEPVQVSRDVINSLDPINHRIVKRLVLTGDIVVEDKGGNHKPHKFTADSEGIPQGIRSVVL